MTEQRTYTSADGTTITAERVGEGPALVLVPGSLQAARSLSGLAGKLSGSYTVHTVNRRGRPGSGPQGEDYSFAKEAEDIIAVLDAERAAAVFGFSSGGLVALETALRYPLDKLAVYEAPVSTAEPVPDPWYPDFEHAMAEGRHQLALSIMLKGLEGLGSVSRMPLPFVRFAVSALTWTQDGRDMVALTPTFAAEYHEVERLAYTPGRYRDTGARTLVMVGSKVEEEYRAGARLLASVIAGSRSVELPGLGHGGPVEAPGQVAAVLLDFFGEAVPGDS
ncbi:alpha/beta fold hydrolase [Nonomuraea sp. SYSU D8015]|uniref:alpha/beta fold hydrolase n=1 Tax=Nonomuraea sp. SYSU D8015 TaxID=2593644 RepID=UPI0016616FDB|nr:alpha/beta hydrolase [Nonomuraea sp. SYSU D8015]